MPLNTLNYQVNSHRSFDSIGSFEQPVEMHSTAKFHQLYEAKINMYILKSFHNLDVSYETGVGKKTHLPADTCLSVLAIGRKNKFLFGHTHVRYFD